MTEGVGGNAVILNWWGTALFSATFYYLSPQFHFFLKSFLRPVSKVRQQSRHCSLLLMNAWTCKGLGPGAQELELDCTPSKSSHFDHWTLWLAWVTMTFFFVSRDLLAPGYTETHYNSTGKEVTSSPQIMVRWSILDLLLIGVWPTHPNAVIAKQVVKGKQHV